MPADPAARPLRAAAGEPPRGVPPRHAGAGVATHAVPTAGAPQPVTLYDDGRHRINLGSNNYLGLAGDPRVIEAAADAVRTVRHQHVRQPGPERHHAPAPRARGGARRPLRHRGGRADLVRASTPTSPCCRPSAAPATSCSSTPTRTRACTPVPRPAGAPSAGSGTTTCGRSPSGSSALDPRAGAVIVVDGVYSMTGEMAPLAEIAALCDRFGARLVVDEAHGLGVLGAAGRGAVEQAGVLDRVDAVTVAFSKSLASVGGAVMTSRAAADGIRASALPYVFSAANDPASVGAALAALRLLRSEPERMAAHPRERRAAAPGAGRCRRAAAARPGRGHRRPHRRGGGHRGRLADRLRRRGLLQRRRLPGRAPRPRGAAARRSWPRTPREQLQRPPRSSGRPCSRRGRWSTTTRTRSAAVA